MYFYQTKIGMFFDLKRENKQCAFGMGDNHNEHNETTSGSAMGELNHRGTEAQRFCLLHGWLNQGEHD